MTLVSLLGAVLLLSLVATHGSNFTEVEAETEQFFNNNGKYPFSKRYTFNDGSICGRRIVVSHFERRSMNISNTADNLEDDIDDSEHLGKILGGNYVAYGDVPWQVAIRNVDLHVCSGAIISEYWAISAALCFYKRQDVRFTIAAGNLRLYYQDPFQIDYIVDLIVVHERFNIGRVWDYNIALIKIRASDGRGFRFNNYIQPICLAYSHENPPVGGNLQVTGWGYTSKESGNAQILKKIILPIISDKECQSMQGIPPTPRTFCAGYSEGYSSLCEADTGAPATIQKGRTHILYGVATIGTACQLSTGPSVFSSISAYREWIDATIKSKSHGLEAVIPGRGYI